MHSNVERKQQSISAKCPICSCSNQAYSTKVVLGDGRIYKCKKCSGYFLFPQMHIDYKSQTTENSRQLKWTEDVQRVNRFIPRILKFFRKQMNKPLDSVLEIGCNTGYLGAGFTEAGCHYTGIDVDSEAISFGKTKGLELYNVSIEKINESPIYGNTYDLVICMNVIEHVNDCLKVFETIQSLGSLGIIFCPNALGLSARLKTFSIYRNIVNRFWASDRTMVYSIDGYWHNLGFTKKTLKYLAGQAELDVLWVRGITNNHKIWGYSEPCGNSIFRLFAMFCCIIGIPNSIYLVASSKLKIRKRST